jgi:peptidoglycan/xylan/chitin deacetylase (PgdA/CDA1 family)
MQKILKITLLFWICVLTLMFAIPSTTYAYKGKTIILTIDDLPFVGSSNFEPGRMKRENERFTQIMNTLVKKGVPAVGFVISSSIERGQWKLLEEFENYGLVIGNHTHTHAFLGQMSAEKYLNDVSKADKKLAPLMHQNAKYFRYPYLYEASGAKHKIVANGIANMGYQVVPVTIDSKDFRFNASFLTVPWRSRAHALPQFKARYINYIWQQTLIAEKADQKHGLPAGTPQVLLIHANLLNSLLLGDIIDFYRSHGYEFVTVDNMHLRDQNYFSRK